VSYTAQKSVLLSPPTSPFAGLARSLLHQGDLADDEVGSDGSAVSLVGQRRDGGRKTDDGYIFEILGLLNLLSVVIRALSRYRDWKCVTASPAAVHPVTWRNCRKAGGVLGLPSSVAEPRLVLLKDLYTKTPKPRR